MALKVHIVSCSEHDHTIVSIEGDVVHQNDYGAFDNFVEALKERGVITVTEEEIDSDEFERRYA